jgi:lipopolysaccharide biosynthesis protein
MKNRKIIAIYYPQYHSIPLNDFHWGKGFTDWDNVKKAQPLFDGHDQPKIPAGDYYDLREVKVLKKQSELAKKYGIYGFCFYHYWFDGQSLLEQPILNFLNEKNIDMPFCLSWANETWTKRWVGDSDTIIIKQNHVPNKELWEAHFNFLLPFFKDERYIKINGKPMFLIYQPFIINRINEMLEYWEKLSIKNGLQGIYFIATKRHEYFPKNCLKMFSGIMKFQPSNARNSRNFKLKSFFTNPYLQKIRAFGERTIDVLHFFKQKFEGVKHINSTEVWDTILKEANEFEFMHKKIFECAYVNWDNTARYGKKATIFSHIEPEVFGKNLEKLFSILEGKEEKNIIFINAWNEWAEGAYLEFDINYGDNYLNQLKKVVEKSSYQYNNIFNYNLQHMII